MAEKCPCIEKDTKTILVEGIELLRGQIIQQVEKSRKTFAKLGIDEDSCPSFLDDAIKQVVDLGEAQEALKKMLICGDVAQPVVEKKSTKVTKAN